VLAHRGDRTAGPPPAPPGWRRARRRRPPFRLSTAPRRLGGLVVLVRPVQDGAVDYAHAREYNGIFAECLAWAAVHVVDEGERRQRPGLAARGGHSVRRRLRAVRWAGTGGPARRIASVNSRYAPAMRSSGVPAPSRRRRRSAGRARTTAIASPPAPRAPTPPRRTPRAPGAAPPAAPAWTDAAKALGSSAGGGCDGVGRGVAGLAVKSSSTGRGGSRPLRTPACRPAAPAQPPHRERQVARRGYGRGEDVQKRSRRRPGDQVQADRQALADRRGHDGRGRLASRLEQVRAADPRRRGARGGSSSSTTIAGSLVSTCSRTISRPAFSLLRQCTRRSSTPTGSSGSESNVIVPWGTASTGPSRLRVVPAGTAPSRWMRGCTHTVAVPPYVRAADTAPAGRAG
jgi:hypothetical protein